MYLNFSYHKIVIPSKCNSEMYVNIPWIWYYLIWNKKGWFNLKEGTMMWIIVKGYVTYVQYQWLIYIFFMVIRSYQSFGNDFQTWYPHINNLPIPHFLILEGFFSLIFPLCFHYHNIIFVLVYFRNINIWLIHERKIFKWRSISYVKSWSI